MNCPACNAEVLDIDMKCGSCGANLTASGAHRMLHTVVLGQYELVDILGQGGMSVVYKGRHKLTEQEVALKILPPELAAHSQVKSRFLEEAKALAALDHPNIVHLYNFGQENGCFVLAMQFVQGKTWERMILEGKRLDWKVSVRIAVDVLRALEYAHGRGVVHRDMKPSNVLVRGDDQSATVMDFGIAKMTTSTKLTATGQTMGTVRYMSPEQVRGQEVDLRTDIYSLGATLYESLTGDTPFDGQTHFEIMTKHLSEPPQRPSARGFAVPAAVEDVVMRSLAKRADDRFAVAREMRVALEGALRLGDVGLLETQRVSRDDLDRERDEVPRKVATTTSPATPPASPASSLRAPTSTPVGNATELADRLEPPAPPRPRKRGLPWLAIALFVLVAGGGGTVAYLLLNRPSTPAKPPAPVVPVVPELEIVAAGGPSDVAAGRAAYDRAFDVVRDLLESKLPIRVQRPVDRVVLVDHRQMCDPGYYDTGTYPVPDDCKTLVAKYTRAAPRTLLVLGDPPGLDAAMREGIARSVVAFGAITLPNTADPAAKEQELDKVATEVLAYLARKR